MTEPDNLEWMLQWCREHIPHFEEMETHAIASRTHTRQVREQMKEKTGYER